MRASTMWGGQKLFIGIVGTILKNGLEGELNDELGYSKTTL
jgi:hypothetical protein